MPDSRPGKITKATQVVDYSIVCADCGEEDVHSAFWNTADYAAKHFRKEGWRLLSQGWFCPDCVKKDA